MARVKEPDTAARVPAGRDLSIDFVRAICLPIVVVLHALQMGIGGDPLETFNALDGYPPLATVTWGGMIMPMFFIAGGFAGLITWRRIRERQGSASDYIRTRTLRLLRPTLLAVAATGALLAVFAVFGADDGFLGGFAHRLAEPLWFIVVYLALTAAVPAMAWLYERHRWSTFAGLAAGAVVVDVVVRLTGWPIGYLNWAFIWLFVQSLGFLVLDGWLAKRPLWWHVLVIACSYAGIGALVVFAGYSGDMLGNLNPPTLVILLLGFAQASILTLLQPAFRRLMQIQGVLVGIGALGIYGFVIYLWHTFAMGLVAGVQQAVELPFPEPLSSGWWITRPFWILAVAAVVVLCCVVVPKLEGILWREPEGSVSIWLAWIMTVVGSIGVGVVLLFGYVPFWQTAAGLALMTMACVALELNFRSRKVE